MNPLIAQYRINDFSRLWYCVDKVCQDEPWMATKRFHPDQRWLRALMESECQSHLLLVANVSNDIVGWCRLFPCSTSTVDLGIGILTKWQHMGIGSGLLLKAKKWASFQGFEEIVLFVSERNKVAIQFYLDNGFSFRGRTKSRLTLASCLN